MSFAQPLALLLLLPLAGGAAALWRGAGGAGGRLPGDWARLVAPPLRAALAAGVVGRDRSRLAAASAAAALLVVALSGPRIEFGPPARFANLVGRVVAVELPAETGPEPARRMAARLIALAPEVPTAIVAAGAESWDVAPLTTDASHLRRYLAVLSPAVLPAAGHNAADAIRHGEALLDRAGIVVGQVALIGAGPPPDAARAPAPPAPGRLRAFVAPAAEVAAWAASARAFDARLAGPDGVEALDRDLAAAAASARRRAPAERGADLAPWATALAGLCWLGLFRRRGG